MVTQIAGVGAIGIIERGNGVDQKRIDGASAYGRAVIAGALRPECESPAPVSFMPESEKVMQLV